MQADVSSPSNLATQPADIGVYTRPFYFYHRVVHFTRRLFDSRFVLRRRRSRVSFRYNVSTAKGIKSVVVARTTGKFVGNLYGDCKSRAERRYKDTQDRRRGNGRADFI